MVVGAGLPILSKYFRDCTARLGFDELRELTTLQHAQDAVAAEQFSSASGARASEDMRHGLRP